MIQHARTVLWVNRSADVPQYTLKEGILRVARNENEWGSFVSLGLEVGQQDPLELATYISLVFKNAQGCAVSPYDHEPDYGVQDKYLWIPRVIRTRALDKHVFLSLDRPLVLQEIGEKKLRLACATLGVLDTLEFVQDEMLKPPLPPDHVKMKVQAIGINFKDVMGLLSRASAKDLGSEYAGIVSAVGESVENVRLSD